VFEKKKKNKYWSTNTEIVQCKTSHILEYFGLIREIIKLLFVRKKKNNTLQCFTSKTDRSIPTIQLINDCHFVHRSPVLQCFNKNHELDLV